MGKDNDSLNKLLGFSPTMNREKIERLEARIAKLEKRVRAAYFEGFEDSYRVSHGLELDEEDVEQYWLESIAAASIDGEGE